MPLKIILKNGEKIIINGAVVQSIGGSIKALVLDEAAILREMDIITDDGVENAATDALSSDLAEEALDQIEPGRRGWREMHVEARMAGRPRLGLGMLMGCVVVGDQVDIERRQDVPVDPVEETDKLLVPVLLHALADQPAVERGEQGGGTVT